MTSGLLTEMRAHESTGGEPGQSAATKPVRYGRVPWMRADFVVRDEKEMAEAENPQNEEMPEQEGCCPGFQREQERYGCCDGVSGGAPGRSASMMWAKRETRKSVSRLARWATGERAIALGRPLGLYLAPARGD